MVTEVTVLLLEGIKLILVTFVTLVRASKGLPWKDWQGLRTMEAGGVAVAGAECSLFSLCPPLLLNRCWNWSLALFLLEQ
eukprot:1152066-Pelagomonas_calceolata.AAC.1